MSQLFNFLSFFCDKEIFQDPAGDGDDIEYLLWIAH